MLYKNYYEEVEEDEEVKYDKLVLFVILINLLWVGSRKYIVCEGIGSLVMIFLFGSFVELKFEDVWY